MIYFSELKGKKVVTEDDVEVGRIEDIIFRVSEKSLVTKIIVRGTLKEKLIIPIQYLKKINSKIVIAKEYIISQLEENELYLVKNLLDKQIIDLKGHKVVRVNDVAIQDKDEMYIAGVDIGILGILRWFRLEEPLYKLMSIFSLKLTSTFLSWGDVQPLELVHGEVKLRIQEEKLQKVRPEDLADYLEKTNVTNVRKFLRILDEKKAVEVIGHLNLNYRASFFRHYKPEKGAHLLANLDPDDAVDILLTLPTKKRSEILENLPDNKKKQFEHLLRYTTSQIGNLLTTEYILVSPNDHVREVIRKIRLETSEFSFLSAIYVINDKKELIGVFNLHELIQQTDMEMPVYKFMIQGVIFVYLTTPVEIALNRMVKYRIGALPVIDESKKIIGIVTVADVVKLYMKNVI